MSKSNDQRTRAFETVSKKKGAGNDESRKVLVALILATVILIVIALGALIAVKVWDKINPQPTLPPENPNEGYTEIYKDAGNVNMGNLLIVNGTYKFNYDLNDMDVILDSAKPENTSLPSNLVNVWLFKHASSANDAETKITSSSTGEKIATYGLGTYATSIVLEENTLHAFNKMLLDYCATLDPKKFTDNSASGLNIAWGWSDSESLKSDITSSVYFYDHCLGTTLTLRNDYNEAIDEKLLKNNYRWIYDNAYKYGFIIRYPSNCGCDRDESSIRLRYVGVEHAYYIHKQGICLDEYIALLNSHYNYSGDHLTFTADNGKSYEIYYVPASVGRDTIVYVPEDLEYTVSGDNMNGFIVTVTK